MTVDNKKTFGIVGLIIFSLIIPIDWLIMSFFDVFGGIVSIIAPVIMLIGFRLFSEAFDKKTWRLAIVLTAIFYIVIIFLTWYTFLSLNSYKSLCQDYELSPESFTMKPSFWSCFTNIKNRFTELNSDDISSLYETLLLGLLSYGFFIFEVKRDIRSLAQPFCPELEKCTYNKHGKHTSRIIYGLFVTILILTASIFLLYLINTSERFAGVEHIIIFFIPYFVLQGLLIIPVKSKEIRTYLIILIISLIVSITTIVLTCIFLSRQWDEYTVYYPFYHSVNSYIFSTKQGLLCAVLYVLVRPILDAVELLFLLNVKNMFTLDTIVAFCGKNIFEKKESDDSTKEIDSETKTSTEMEHK